MASGDNNRKLNMSIAKEIRLLYLTENYTHKKLAEKYKVNKSTIWNILNNFTYKVE